VCWVWPLTDYLLQVQAGAGPGGYQEQKTKSSGGGHTHRDAECLTGTITGAQTLPEAQEAAWGAEDLRAQVQSDYFQDLAEGDKKVGGGGRDWEEPGDSPGQSVRFRER
jgi:hypothetical protein